MTNGNISENRYHSSASPAVDLFLTAFRIYLGTTRTVVVRLNDTPSLSKRMLIALQTFQIQLP